MKFRIFYLRERLKYLVFLILAGILVTANQSFGQEVTITKKDSTVIETKITATSTNSLHTNNGTFSKTDLAKVDFKVNNPRDEKLYDDLKSIGIAVSFSGKNYDKVVEIRQSPLLVKPTSTSADLDQLYDSLEEFRKQRTIGKGLQLAGVLAVGASIFLSQSSEPDADMIKGLSIGGAALSGIGFIVDLDAGRHLKLKRTP